MTSHSLKKQVGFLLFGKIAGFLILTILPIIMVRLLSQHQFGVYRQILFITGLVIPLVRLRILQSLYYFYPRLQEDSRFKPAFYPIRGLSVSGGSSKRCTCRPDFATLRAD